MTRADIVIGLLLAAGFGAVLWEASTFQYGTEFAPGPGFAPVWLGVMGIVLGLFIAATAFRAVKGAAAQREESSEISLERAGLTRVAATLLGLVGFILLVPWLGLALAVLVFLLYLTLGVQRLSLVAGITASGGTVFFIHLVFVTFLGVPLPTGPLGF